MKYRLYTTSRKAWDGMLKAILEAGKSIFLEMYILLEDTKDTHNFLDLLKDKALAGLNVSVIADAYGSSHLSNKKVKELRGAGVEFIFFGSWLRRTHRKILIVDEKLAFIGGVNINKKIIEWRDMQIRVSGKIVKPLLKSFANGYRLAGGKKDSILKYSQLSLTRKIKSLIIDSLPGTRKKYRLSDYYIDRILEAKKSIIIVTPYLVPPRRLLAALDTICRNGIKVEIIIPNDTDVKSLNKVNYLNACRLSDIGVKFYLSPVMNHAKLLLIDNEIGLIGSQNFDILSFNFNIEAGVFFSQKKLVADLQKIIEKWRSEAEPFEFKRNRHRFSDKILISIIKIFYPIF